MHRDVVAAAAQASIYIVLMPAIACVIADDLTGAADTAAGFAGVGLATIVTWPGPHADAAVTRADAVAIDAGTRILDADDARGVTLQVVSALRASGVPTLYKKCDSLLRGHIGLEVAATLDAWHPGAIAIVAPAFPAAGRTTIGGRQHVQGRAIDPPIARLFEGTRIPTVELDLEMVRSEDLRDELHRLPARTAGVAVCDAQTDDDLARIVRAGVDLAAPIWVGSGGLVRALARISFVPPAHPRPLPVPARTGPILIVSGSATEIARLQAARLRDTGVDLVFIDASALEDEDDSRRGRAADTLRQHLLNGQDVAFAVAPGQGGTDRRIAEALGALVAPCAALVGGLVATGGDTATAVLREWGATALHIVDEIEPGVPLAIAEGRHPVGVVTKAGAFGDVDTFVRARARLHAMLEHRTGVR
jgi:D-threonate/D-erythronate kinase